MINEKIVAFTFDDVPSYEDLGDNPTTVILNVLERFGGKATFFVTGKGYRKNGRKLIDAILERGHEIANHSNTHANLTELDAQGVKEEVLTLQDDIKRDFGIEMKYFRPAGLSVNKDVFAVLNELKMPIIHGSHKKAYLADWNKETPSEEIKKRCLENVYPGQIVLMHGYSLGTQAVFEEICETLSKDGYRFVTLTELFKAYGVEELPCDRPIIDAQLTRI